MVWSLDEPYGGGLPSWYVFRFMAEDVKVGLTGTGGDELFGNYRRFVPFEHGATARPPPRRRAPLPLRAVVLLHRRGEARARCRRPGHVGTAAACSTTRAAAPARATRCSTSTSRRSSRTSSCTMTDRFSMAQSLEARTPFLDHELVELRRVAPARAANGAGRPEGAAARRRCGPADAGPPRGAEARLRLPARALAPRRAAAARGAARLADEHLRAQGIFRPRHANFLLAPRRPDESERLWPVLMFQLWHLLYVEEALTDAPSFSWRELTAGVR